MGKPGKTGRRSLQLREKIVVILRERGPTSSPVLRECLIDSGLRNIGSNRSIGQAAVSTPGVKKTGTVRIPRATGEGSAEYAVYSLVSENAWNVWRAGK